MVREPEEGVCPGSVDDGRACGSEPQVVLLAPLNSAYVVMGKKDFQNYNKEF
jgi:hypothetical protein